MTAMSAHRAPAAMSVAERKRQVAPLVVITLLASMAVASGAFAHFSLHQAWGLPLVGLAMLAGFGAQIAFILGLVKASRHGKDV